jgi:porin
MWTRFRTPDVGGAHAFAAGFALLLALMPSVASSQTAGASQGTQTANSTASPTVPYVAPDILDGSLSGLGDELDDESPKSSYFRFPSMLDPWFALKQRLRQKYGFVFGGSWGVLGQDYSNTLIGEHNSVGQKFTLNLGQQLLFRGTPDALWIEAVFEDRGPLGTNLAPLQAGLATGSSTATAPTWGDFNFGLTQLYLRQSLFDNHVQYTVGKLFAPNYVNPYPFFDDNRQYLNQIFTTSVTIPVPLRGAGAVAAIFPGNSGIYAKAGIYTVYSEDTGWTVDSFFNKPDYFTHLELGWSATAGNGVPIQARGPMDANNVSLTVWNKDAEQNGPPAAHGVAFNANFLVSPNIMVFGRGGLSEGWLIDRNLSFGLGWRPTEHYSDLFGIGAGWAQPANSVLQDQYIFEVFYRFQVTPNLAITPDVQLIEHPTLAPDVDSLWVLSLRGRVTF